MDVGFIGTGNIGTPMAANILKAGFNLVVHDIVKSNAAPLLQQGAEWADSPKEVADCCDIICTCLPGPAQMEEVTLGAGGIAEGMRRGAVYIDHTTNSPLTVRKIHDVFRERGVDMLDAPVSGGAEGAATRDLFVMVGGDPATVAGCMPILDAVGKQVYHTGEIGAGSVCKIMHNAASFCADMAMSECWSLAVKAGVQPQVILDVFRRAALGSMTNLHVRLPETYFQGNFDARFALNIAHKDLGLATELGQAYQVQMRMVDICEQEYAEAMSRGWSDRDSSIVLTLQDERAGVQVRLPKSG